MSGYKVVNCGDSVAWGQGLLTEQKYHVLAGTRLRALIGGGARPEFMQLAHSGARIDEPTEDTPLDRNVELWQEVPNDTPTISEQVEEGGRMHGDARLVLLNGGMNDIDFRAVLDPSELDEDALEAAIADACHRKMKALIVRARRAFPDAILVVSGYYPMLSEASKLAVARLVVTLLALLPGGGPVVALATPALAKRAIRRARYFHGRQLHWLRKSVTEAQADAQVRGPGVLFAHPAFGPLNAVGGSRALLFGPKSPEDVEGAWARIQMDPVTNLLLIEPDDPQSGPRRLACDALASGAERITCAVAAIGHPNVRGARRYADTIVNVITSHLRTSLRSPVAKLLDQEGSGALSLRGALERYRIADRPTSVRASFQLLQVDSLTVTVATADELGAGTDDEVALRVGPGRRWVLNETLFEGDLANDFERGKTGEYSVDPAGGDPARRMALWEIKEVSLELRSAADLPDEVEERLGLTWKPASLRLQVNGREVFRTAIGRTIAPGRRWRARAPAYPAARMT